MKVIVADTGPVLHLHQAGALDLLPALGEIHITPTVIAELRWHAPDFRKSAADRSGGTREDF